MNKTSMKANITCTCERPNPVVGIVTGLIRCSNCNQWITDKSINATDDVLKTAIRTKQTPYRAVFDYDYCGQETNHCFKVVNAPASGVNPQHSTETN